MNPLEEQIRSRIRREGPLPFDEFMHLALYHPELGYYAKNPKIGRGGDFYTSVSVGPLFGRLLARQFYQMWRLYSGRENFWIVEQGAHDGQLARDILDWCRAETPDFFASLRYGIVQGPAMEGTTSFANLEALAVENPVGVFFSNELVDAFPVRVIVYRGGKWAERCVAVAHDALAWTERPIEDLELLEAISLLPLPEIEGYTTEINLRARRWIGEVARAMKRGYVVTIDYGYPAFVYYAAHRTAGTLTAYAKHRRVDDVLANPGGQDITTHVDFMSLARAGKEAGLKTLGRVNQQQFLTGIAYGELSGHGGPSAGVAEQTRAFQTLTHPEHLGSRFHALVQSTDTGVMLDCLRFARKEDLWEKWGV